MAELVGLVSGRRLACFSGRCGPLPDHDAAANAPRIASGPALQGPRPSSSLTGCLAPLGWLGHVFSAGGSLSPRKVRRGRIASHRDVPRDKRTSRLHALSMRWVLMLFVVLAAVMGGEARAVVVMGRVVVSERVGG